MKAQATPPSIVRGPIRLTAAARSDLRRRCATASVAKWGSIFLPRGRHHDGPRAVYARGLTREREAACSRTRGRKAGAAGAPQSFGGPESLATRELRGAHRP